MLALRRLGSRPCVLGSRGNATLNSTTNSANSAPPPAHLASSTSAAKQAPPPTQKGKAPSPTSPYSSKAAASARLDSAPRKTRGRIIPTRRPMISLEHPRAWNRPLAPGVLPAYDLALQFINRDSEVLRGEARELRERILKAEADEVPVPEEELSAMREKLGILEVQSEINRPDVRWKFANGMGDMSQPVYRHLAEQRWREDGAFDLLMERIHQMSVVPDVLPDLHPSLDLRLTFPQAPDRPSSRLEDAARKSKHKAVEPGVFLEPASTREQPNLYVSVFHEDTRLYTLLMVDPDAPDEENASFQTFVHWLQPNVPLSSASSHVAPFADPHTPYIPPHPQRGTPYHRYTLLLLPQSKTLVVPPIEREAFDLRAFVDQHELGTSGGGAHMWREKWSEDVSKIYAEVLNTEEPRYGPRPKPDRYAYLREVPKYPS